MSKLEKTREFRDTDGKLLFLTTTRRLSKDQQSWQVSLRLKISSKPFNRTIATRDFSKTLQWPASLLTLLIEGDERELLLNHGVAISAMTEVYSIASEYPEEN